MKGYVPTFLCLYNLLLVNWVKKVKTSFGLHELLKSAKKPHYTLQKRSLHLNFKILNLGFGEIC